MNLIYPNDIDQINLLFDRISNDRDEVLCTIRTDKDDGMIIYYNGLVKLKSIPHIRTLDVLTHPNLTAIMSVHLTPKLIIYL